MGHRNNNSSHSEANLFATPSTAQHDSISQVEHVPGTEILLDQFSQDDSSHGGHHQLKHRTKGNTVTPFLLVPQPSLNDPNDPLRWSTITKSLVFFNGCWYSFMGAVTGPIMAAGMIQLSVTFNTSLQRLTYANGACLINQGFWNIVWMPFAVKYGRRPVYLFSCILMGIACVWLAIASNKDYTTFIIGRAFLGAFEAPIESIVPSTITDMFFLHNRGELVALYGLSVLGGNEIGPIVSGFIVQALGMDWAFWIVAIFIFANAVSIFFFMPETKFTGPRPSLSDRRGNSRKDDADHIPSTANSVTKDNAPATAVSEMDILEEIPKRTWIQELKFWSRGDPNINLLHTFLRPFVLLAYPTVIWSCCLYGLALSWNVILGATVAQLFAPPPYAFTSSEQGLFFVSPFIGSLVGVYLSGSAADWIANWLTKRNRGIREPEMRLWTCLIAAAFTFIGALWYGLAYEHKTHWALPVVGAGVLSVGSQMGTTLGINYALDCHQQLSIEIMVTIAVVKSAIAWIWTWVINDFITSKGLLTVLMVVATVNVVVYLFCIPFYFYGKRIRVWLHQKNLFAAAKLE